VPNELTQDQLSKLPPLSHAPNAVEFYLTVEKLKSSITESNVAELHCLASSIEIFLSTEQKEELAEFRRSSDQTVIGIRKDEEPSKWFRMDRAPDHIKEALDDLAKTYISHLPRKTKATYTILGLIIRITLGNADYQISEYLKAYNRKLEEARGSYTGSDPSLSPAPSSQEVTILGSLTDYRYSDGRRVAVEAAPMKTNDSSGHLKRAKYIFHFLFKRSRGMGGVYEDCRRDFLKSNGGCIIGVLPWESNLYKRNRFIYCLFLAELKKDVNLAQAKSEDAVTGVDFANLSIKMIRDKTPH